MEPQLYEAGMLQEAVVPMALPWICWVPAAWIMWRSSWVRTMFVSQFGPSHWAWAGTIKRPKKIGMIALISVDIVVLTEVEIARNMKHYPRANREPGPWAALPVDSTRTTHCFFWRNDR